uniref:RRM domain-containing protein n=1 Tax=Graphocephala atropunctata TaxID=36148 RepID=A0A1B6MTY9_9HEMI
MTAMAKTKKTHNKHSSKSQQKKQWKGKKDFKPSGKRGRLIIRNLPFKCNENEVHKHFKPFGDIKDIKLLRRPDKKLVGCGFVEYKSRLNADKAIEQLNGKQFLGRPIYVEKAVARERYDETSRSESQEISNQGDSEEEVGKVKNESDESEIKRETESDEDKGSLDTSEIKQETPSEEKNIMKSKDKRKNTNLKQARLIIRNLSFKATEDKLKEHFAKFGDITEVKLLRRPDKTLVGCGFVQFAKKQGAAKAIYHTSGKPFLERPIIVDWAVAKDRFTKMQEEASKMEIKKEDDEEMAPVDVSNTTVKEEESDQESKEEESDSEEEDGDDDDNDDDDEEEQEEEDDQDVKSNIKQEPEERKRQRKEDVDEGKTVFVKNLPFSANDKEFQECMEQFGPVFYALVCKDKLTEHSRGSGFVKFKEKDDAEKCLSAGTELTLKGNILDPHPALKRGDVQKLNDKTKEKKDNRNLYLTKEGMIIAGTPAARGVSVNDMERRLQLEQWKTTKLRNLNMFVSRNRLVIHNLPATFSDKQLRKLFQSHAGPTAIIKETRIMRNLKQVDSKGVSISKGFGFVSFEKHEDALKALRCINNNPSVFTPTTRPIVAFSIENRSVLNTKTKRVARSRQKNPLCKEYNPNDEEVPAKKSKYENHVKQEEQSEPQFAGFTAKPGSTVKMRQKYKLQNQVQQHSQDVKKQKREMKMSRKVRRVEHLKQKQTEKKTNKKNKKVVDNDSAFTKLVDKYKSKLLSQPNDKKKWYDT